MFKWLRYSGASVIIAVNPLHWSWRPQARRAFIDEWVGPHERAWFVGWLFLTVRVWIDDGSW
jgi:hypothetical protein